MIRSDKAKKLIQGEAKRHCDAEGITIEGTAGHWPESNRVAEQSLRGIVEKRNIIRKIRIWMPNFGQNPIALPNSCIIMAPCMAVRCRQRRHGLVVGQMSAATGYGKAHVGSTY